MTDHAHAATALPESEFRIPEEHREVWEKLRTFKVDDDPEAPYTFARKIAFRNKWSEEYTAVVIGEYFKFLYLAVVCGYTVTPSKDVDEVWHVHLQYTKSYWWDFCYMIAKRPIHHHPGNGTNEDTEKYRAIYERTLDDYAKVFGTPPCDVWGHPDNSFDWRSIVAKLPITPRVKSNLFEMFPRPFDEARS